MASSPFVAIFFPVLGLTLCGAIYEILSRQARKIPYTVVVFLAGVSITGMLLTSMVLTDGRVKTSAGTSSRESSMMNTTHRNGLTNVMGESALLWISMEPHLFLSIFLPPLLFADCVHINIPLVRRFLMQPVILASLGVVFSVWLIANLVTIVDAEHRVIFLDSSQLMILAATLAATDPVAVTRLLDAVGASAILKLQVAGEAVLNDGIAMVIFYAILRDIYPSTVGGNGKRSPRNHQFSLVRSILTLDTFRMITVGPIIGIVLGMIATHRLNQVDDRSHYARISCVSIAIFTCYSSYLLPELCESSGVLGVVSAGLVIAGKARGVVAHRGFKELWEYIEYLANSLIFLISGGLFVKSFCVYMKTRSALYPSQTGSGVISIAGIRSVLELMAGIALIYFITLLARFLMVFILLPYLRVVGPKGSLPNSSAVVIAWSGLRGGVALALSLIAEQRCDQFSNQTEQLNCSLMPVYTAGVVFCTLVINGTTCEYLVTRLGIGRNDIKDECTRSLLLRVEKEISRLGKMLENEIDSLISWEYGKCVRDCVNPDSVSNLRNLSICLSEKTKEKIEFNKCSFVSRLQTEIFQPEDEFSEEELSKNSTLLCQTTRDDSIRRDFWGERYNTRGIHPNVVSKSRVEFMLNSLLNVTKSEYVNMMNRNVFPRGGRISQILLDSVDHALRLSNLYHEVLPEESDHLENNCISQVKSVLQMISSWPREPCMPRVDNPGSNFLARTVTDLVDFVPTVFHIRIYRHFRRNILEFYRGVRTELCSCFREMIGLFDPFANRVGRSSREEITERLLIDDPTGEISFLFGNWMNCNHISGLTDLDLQPSLKTNLHEVWYLCSSFDGLSPTEVVLLIDCYVGAHIRSQALFDHSNSTIYEKALIIRDNERKKLILAFILAKIPPFYRRETYSMIRKEVVQYQQLRYADFLYSIGVLGDSDLVKISVAVNQGSNVRIDRDRDEDPPRSVTEPESISCTSSQSSNGSSSGVRGLRNFSVLETPQVLCRISYTLSVVRAAKISEIIGNAGIEDELHTLTERIRSRTTM